MTNTTKELVSYLTQKKIKIDYTIVSAYSYSILKCGTKLDADIILEYFISEPFKFQNIYLLSILEKWGDMVYAEKIFDAHLKNDRLINPEHPEVLELLGKLNYSGVEPVLIHYAFNAKTNYYAHKYAVLGLLNFDCKKIENLIREKITATFDKGFFEDEFTPALVCKLANRKDVLLKLYESGRTQCSSDCNSGIILGLSLCGKEGLQYFWDVIYNDFWEASNTGTGNVWYVYQGLINLNISISELYLDIKNKTNLIEQKNAVEVLLELIDIKISDQYSNVKLESFTDLYSKLFSWETENTSNNVVDLAQKFGLENKAYELEKLIEFQVREEILLKNYLY